jgi:hypothetical protein
MPVATLAAILGHADLRSVMKYVHVRQEAQDREMERFEQTQNILAAERSSGFRPVKAGEMRDTKGWSGNIKPAVTNGKIN